MIAEKESFMQAISPLSHSGPLSVLSEEPDLDHHSESSLGSRCQLNWQDYTMIAGIAITIIFLVVSIVLQQWALVAGFATMIPFLFFGEYYIYSYSDYREMKEQIEQMDAVRKQLVETNQELLSNIDGLKVQIAELQEENRRFKNNNSLYERENESLKKANLELEKTRLQLQQTAKELENIAKKTVPELYEAYMKITANIKVEQQAQLELITSSVKIQSQIESSSRELSRIKEELAAVKQELASEVRRLQEVSKKLEKHASVLSLAEN